MGDCVVRFIQMETDPCFILTPCNSCRSVQSPLLPAQEGLAWGAECEQQLEEETHLYDVSSRSMPPWTESSYAFSKARAR